MKNLISLLLLKNFESYSASGGRLLEQARYMPSHGYKGGVGAYRVDNDYDNKPDYKWMRQAIRINQETFQQWKEQQGKTEESNNN